MCFNALQVSQGFGKHVTHLNLEQEYNVRKWNYALEFPVQIGLALSKISISLLLLRLLGTAASRVRKYFLHGLNVFIGIYSLLNFLNDITACTPFAKRWNVELPGRCRSEVSRVDFSIMQGGWYYGNFATVEDFRS